MEKITSYNALSEAIKEKEKAFLLLYKNGSDISNCAYNNMSRFAEKGTLVPVYTADVNIVNDIHLKYNITSVPSLLIFEKGEFTNVIKGCHESSYYKALIDNAIFQARQKAEGKEPKRVTVYSTPTCSWCNTLKSWLRKNNVPFTDIDVSRDEKTAEELVRRSGQQGVPQTEINGQIVVGFNQQRLKELLEIQ